MISILTYTGFAFVHFLQNYNVQKGVATVGRVASCDTSGGFLWTWRSEQPWVFQRRLSRLFSLLFPSCSVRCWGHGAPTHSHAIIPHLKLLLTIPPAAADWKYATLHCSYTGIGLKVWRVGKYVLVERHSGTQTHSLSNLRAVNSCVFALGQMRDIRRGWGGIYRHMELYELIFPGMLITAMNTNTSNGGVYI